ncbi:MAG: cytochrome c3 family protein [Bacteroidales bacterium]|nr:cytochrome c3 family protein [Bacteroidales bacterium]
MIIRHNPVFHSFSRVIFFTIISLSSTLTFAEDISEPLGNPDHSENHLNAFSLKKGERLFYGLISLGENMPSCASCHYTAYTDTLNWNPSAYDIAGSYSSKSIEELRMVLMEPGGKKMTEVHAGYNLNDEQVELIHAFFINLNESQAPPKKPVINNLFIFILLHIIILLAVIDLFFTKKIKFKAVHLVVILAGTIWITKTVVVESIAVGRQKNYAPLQPIKFSHKVHAGTNGTDCFYCHNIAERSKTAGIPSANVCMNCHIIVREGTNSGKFEINKILTAYDNNMPIEWIKIHNLPDHVFFSHAQHVGAGKLDCAECHGTIKEMDVVHQVNDLSMGWCLDCHRTRKVQFVENEYYETFKDYHAQIVSGQMDSLLVAQIGGTNCMKCHY